VSRCSLALGLVLSLAAGCSETRLRPDDTDTDVDPDSDSDTDSGPLVRQGCLDGELDEGWAFETLEGLSSHNVRPLQDGQILLRTGFSGRPKRGGVFLLGVDEWRSGALSTDVERIDNGGLGGGFHLVSPLTVDGADGRGFGGIGAASDFEHMALTWSEWPGPGTTAETPDGRIESELLDDLYSEFADVDGDGLTDLVVADRSFTGVVHGPLVGAFTDDDIEPLPLGLPGYLSDWDADGYDDLVAFDFDAEETVVWLGPVSGLPSSTPPDVRIRGRSSPSGDVQGRRVTLNDVDGDGLRELWLTGRPFPEVEVYRSINYPGTGAFEADEEASIIIDHDDRILPQTGDFDGDGSIDVLMRRARDQQNETEQVLLAGPLGPGTYQLSDGISRVFPSILNNPSVLGDVNGDGRDDFVVENTGNYGVGDEGVSRSVLYLGCPGW